VTGVTFSSSRANGICPRLRQPTHRVANGGCRAKFRSGRPRWKTTPLDAERDAEVVANSIMVDVAQKTRMVGFRCELHRGAVMPWSYFRHRKPLFGS